MRNLSVPEALIQQYRGVVRDHGTEAEQVAGEILLAILRKDEGRYAEAFSTMDRALEKFPRDLKLLSNVPAFYSAMVDDLEALGEMAPESAEFGAAYDHLLVLGLATPPIHLAALHHSIANGLHGQAREIAEKLRQACPNLLGLEDAIRLMDQTQEKA